jgi:LacI family transcriptional regulator, repressor for deo operon, udp, cdd, tsx, nupC, and nupG
VTAVLAYNDLMAIGALRAVRRRGGSVPGDVSIVGFDDVALAAYVDPPLTTLSQSTAEMGYWAVARLTERLRPGTGDDSPADDATNGGGGRSVGAAPVVMLPVRLEVRGSTGPPRSS